MPILGCFWKGRSVVLDGCCYSTLLEESYVFFTFHCLCIWCCSMWLVLPWVTSCWMSNTFVCYCRLEQVPRRGGLEPPMLPVLSGFCSSGTAVSVPWYCGVTASSAWILLQLFFCRVWGTLPAIPHSTERPFRNSKYMGGWGGRKEGEGCLNCLQIKICACCLWLILI